MFHFMQCYDFKLITVAVYSRLKLLHACDIMVAVTVCTEFVQRVLLLVSITQFD